jgi:hypothetical protein
MGKINSIRTGIKPSLKAAVEAITVEIPNALTVKTLRESEAGKGVKRLATKKDLYADLGLSGMNSQLGGKENQS